MPGAAPTENWDKCPPELPPLAKYRLFLIWLLRAMVLLLCKVKKVASLFGWLNVWKDRFSKFISLFCEGGIFGQGRLEEVPGGRFKTQLD